MEKLSIELRPSRYLAAFLLLTHGGALLILIFLHLPGWVQIGVSLSVVISFLWLFRLYITRQSKRSVLKLRVEADGTWYLKLRNGKELKAYLKGDSFSAEKLLILNFRPESKSNALQGGMDGHSIGKWAGHCFCWLESKKLISVIIFSDAVDKNTFRELRIWLNLFSKK